GYDLGTTSAFYEVEEAVFAAVETHVFSCPASITEIQETTLFFDSVTNYIRSDVNAKIQVYDVLGKIVVQSNRHANGVDVNALPSGCYIAVSNKATLKFVVN
ncbi:MAG: T9SS type A sorting domain-containing protein, partial [Flavobacteriales bacterium]|nr:T9SS type A sorting domain-containing protein [Flavobacteriales bacterium]